MMKPVQGNNYVAQSSAKLTDLQSQGLTTQTSTTQGQIVVTSSGETFISGHFHVRTTPYLSPSPGCQTGSPGWHSLRHIRTPNLEALVTLPLWCRPSLIIIERPRSKVAQAHTQMYESFPRETVVHFLTTSTHAQQQLNGPPPRDTSPEYKITQASAGPPRSLSQQHRTPSTLPTQPVPPPFCFRYLAPHIRSHDDSKSS